MTPRYLFSLAALAACSPHHQPKQPTTVVGAPMTVNKDPNLVDFSVTPTTTLVAASTVNELGLRVHITARDVPDANRPPLDLALVLDTSGSMEGDAIEKVRTNAHTLVDKMRDGDVVSVVAFHSKVDVLVPATRITASSRATITRAIETIKAHGTTDLVDGLSEGARQVAAGNMNGAIRRIVLLSDGVPNDSAQLPALLVNLHAGGVPVSTFGLGIDFDDTVMTRIATQTGGSYTYVDKPEQIAKVFDEELSKMSTVVAHGMQVTLVPGPGVTFRPMPGLQPGADGRVVAFIGDLSAGESRDLMLPIAASARGNGSTVELTDATLVYTDAIGHSGGQTREAYASVKASTDKTAVASAVVVALEATRVRATAAGAILEAIAMARGGQIPAARDHLAKAIVAVKEAMARVKDPELSEIVAELEDVQKEVSQMVVPQAAVQIPVDKPSVADMAPAPQQPAVAPESVERSIRIKQDHAMKRVNGRK